MAQGYHEKGIKDDADYGTQFLNARKEDGGGGGDEPPRPPPPTPSPGGRSAGSIIAIVLVVVAVVGGLTAFVLAAPKDGDSGDLIADGEGVDIGDHDRREETTTTTDPPRETTTSTAAPTTTTTSPPPTTPITPPTPTSAPIVTPAPTLAPSCPGGFAGSQLSVNISALPASQWRVTINGTTRNDTTASINLLLTVPINGSGGTTDARPDKYGTAVAPGATLAWTATATVDSSSEPTVTRAAGTWAWTDPQYASCATGTFG
jgi:hypothetical protein